MTGIGESPGDVGADGADGRDPADPEAGPLRQLAGVETGEGVAGVVEGGDAPLGTEPVFVFEAGHHERRTADHVAGLVLGPEGLIAVPAHALVAAGEEPEAGRELAESVRLRGADLEAAEQAVPGRHGADHLAVDDPLQERDVGERVLRRSLEGETGPEAVGRVDAVVRLYALDAAARHQEVRDPLVEADGVFLPLEIEAVGLRPAAPEEGVLGAGEPRL